MYTYVHSTFLCPQHIRINWQYQDWYFQMLHKTQWKIFHAFKTPAHDIGKAVIEQVAHQFVGH